MVLPIDNWVLLLNNQSKIEWTDKIHNGVTQGNGMMYVKSNTEILSSAFLVDRAVD